MNKLRIASTVIALASAVTVPAWAADTTDVSKDGASNLDSPVTQPANSNAAPSASKATQSKARKHPPTAAIAEVPSRRMGGPLGRS